MTGAEIAVNPATGEVLERLDEQPPEILAEVLDVVHAHQAQLKAWGSALDAELRRRLKLRQTKRATFGDWEVEASTGRESVWDAAELEPVLAQLVDQGAVAAGEITDIITRPPVVARAKAKTLAARLTGDAQASVTACCTWKDKPGPLTVTRSVNLLDAAAPAPPPPAAAAHPPMTSEELFA